MTVKTGFAKAGLLAACAVGAFSVAGVASAQSVWETPALPVVKDGNWAGSAGAGAAAAAQKGMAAAGKASADVTRSTAYGVTHPGEVVNKSAAASSITYDETRAGFMEAAESPLRDFNLMQRAIPVVLLAAEKGPYDARGLSSCKAIGDQVAALDLALGPDVDTPNIEKIRDPYARSASFVASSALAAVKDVTSKVVPARNLLRRASGADKYDKDVKNAVLAGAVRRGFLKAYGMMHECDWPAAPIGFQPARASDWNPEPGLHTTPVRTIASNSGAMGGDGLHGVFAGGRQFHGAERGDPHRDPAAAPRTGPVLGLRPRHGSGRRLADRPLAPRPALGV